MCRYFAALVVHGECCVMYWAWLKAWDRPISFYVLPFALEFP